MKTEIRIKRCTECANNCPLDKPKCITGRERAKSGDIYETVVKKNRIESLTEMIKYRIDKS